MPGTWLEGSTHIVVWCLQVLELVLPYASDLSTLLVCSSLSQQSQQLVQDAVRLNLAPLVKQLPESARAGAAACGSGGAGEQQLLWLCSTAGHAAMNIHDNACAILKVLDNWPVRMSHDCKAEGEQRLHTHGFARCLLYGWLAQGCMLLPPPTCPVLAPNLTIVSSCHM
jgi:hypothetical protein